MPQGRKRKEEEEGEAEAQNDDDEEEVEEEFSRSDRRRAKMNSRTLMQDDDVVSMSRAFAQELFHAVREVCGLSVEFLRGFAQSVKESRRSMTMSDERDDKSNPRLVRDKPDWTVKKTFFIFLLVQIVTFSLFAMFACRESSRRDLLIEQIRKEAAEFERKSSMEAERKQALEVSLARKSSALNVQDMKFVHIPSIGSPPMLNQQQVSEKRSQQGLSHQDPGQKPEETAGERKQGPNSTPSDSSKQEAASSSSRSDHSTSSTLPTAQPTHAYPEALQASNYPSTQQVNTQQVNTQQVSTQQVSTQQVSTQQVSTQKADVQQVISQTALPEFKRFRGQFKFRLIVLTCDRPVSLLRLLNSLLNAQYDGMQADLHVHQDRRPSSPPDPQTTAIVESFNWPHGVKTLHQWSVHVGIMGNWIHSWQPNAQDENKIAIFLEDDLEVSPHFARWFLAAHLRFLSDPSVSCFSAMRAQLRASDPRGEGDMENTMKETTTVFKYKLLGTWSFSPKATAWREFRAWFERMQENKAFVPLVEGIMPSLWYQQFQQEGRESSMWEMWLIRFMEERKEFCVYPWAPGRKTLVANWKEPGLHYQGEAKKDHELLADWDGRLIAWPQVIPVLDWDGQEMKSLMAAQPHPPSRSHAVSSFSQPPPLPPPFSSSAAASIILRPLTSEQLSCAIAKEDLVLHAMLEQAIRTMPTDLLLLFVISRASMPAMFSWICNTEKIDGKEPPDQSGCFRAAAAVPKPPPPWFQGIPDVADPARAGAAFCPLLPSQSFLHGAGVDLVGDFFVPLPLPSLRDHLLLLPQDGCRPRVARGRRNVLRLHACQELSARHLLLPQPPAKD
eukprot:558458-Hanusia_phi.AAC.1